MMPYFQMNQIMPNLWLGDYRSSQNVEELKISGVSSVVSVVGWRVSIDETFTQHQIILDDFEGEDILSHFLPAIHFIQAEIDKGRGVLVHCQAGMSRSASIVTAYLMYTKKIDATTALEIVKKARPIADPNVGFRRQLDLFHNTGYKMSPDHRPIRKFYVDSAVEKAKNGERRIIVEKDMLAGLAPEKGASIAAQRKIRCKKCRQDLAAREHVTHTGRSEADEDLERLLESQLPEWDFEDKQDPAADIDADKAAKAIGEAASNAVSGPSAPKSALPATRISAPAQFAAQVTSNPLLASLRNASPIESSKTPTEPNPPILTNAKCSGYFVEPMKWMNHFLSMGEPSGKITCPNAKCNMKLGNYDWAGVHCGCDQWITPGFCINRSKVDEIG